MIRKLQGSNQSLQGNLKANKLQSPFEWKMDATTPDRPFRDRFKLGHNKVSGKITSPSEENAFLAMSTYLEKQNRLQNEYATMYNPKPRNSLISKSSSWSKIENPKRINKLNIDNDKKAQNFTSLAPKLNFIDQNNQAFAQKVLPKIKSERLIKAKNWRKKKNRVPGQASNQVSYLNKYLHSYITRQKTTIH